MHNLFSYTLAGVKRKNSKGTKTMNSKETYTITWDATCKGVFTLEVPKGTKNVNDVAIELIETVLGGAMDTENIDICVASKLNEEESNDGN